MLVKKLILYVVWNWHGFSKFNIVWNALRNIWRFPNVQPEALNRRSTDNTMAKRRSTDNTMAKRRSTDNTMAKRRSTDNTMTKRRSTDNTMAKGKMFVTCHTVLFHFYTERTISCTIRWLCRAPYAYCGRFIFFNIIVETYCNEY